MKLFNRDMKDYKAVEKSNIVKVILLALTAAIVIIGVTSKTAQDEESYKVEQKSKLERM